MNDEKKTCMVCPHRCVVSESVLGLCGARGLRDGVVSSLNYAKATALSLDPIEKKPFAQFSPGSQILSYGSFGCNMTCPFCQNDDISTMDASDEGRTRPISPEHLVAVALDARGQGNIGIAYTYNELLISPEYLMDAGTRAHEVGLVNVVVTNGYVTEETFADLIPVIDAMNIDLKVFSRDEYRKLGAPDGLDVVLGTIEAAYNAGIHVELTTLVVPEFSDDEDIFKEECQWIAALDPEIPLHISRFFPAYKEKGKEPTSKGLMQHFERIAQRSLSNVYLGNM